MEGVIAFVETAAIAAIVAILFLIGLYKGGGK